MRFGIFNRTHAQEVGLVVGLLLSGATGAAFLTLIGDLLQQEEK